MLTREFCSMIKLTTMALKSAIQAMQLWNDFINWASSPLYQILCSIFSNIYVLFICSRKNAQSDGAVEYSDREARPQRWMRLSVGHMW